MNSAVAPSRANLDLVGMQDSWMHSVSTSEPHGASCFKHQRNLAPRGSSADVAKTRSHCTRI